MIQMPTLKFVKSPNYSSRNGQSIRLIVIHSTQGSYAGAISWFAIPRSQVSAHFIMREDGGEVTQMAALTDKAWHACNANPYSIGIEGAGYAERGFSDTWWQSMANIVAWLCHRYAIYPRWAKGGEGQGYASHHDLGAMGGNHSDPCAVGSDDWQRFIGFVNDAYAAMETGPLPSWAPIGVLPVTAISAAPNVPPEPSHGNATRHDLDIGSTVWVQAALNAIHVTMTPLVVDGQAGPMTRAAIARFQGQHSLYVDGTAGGSTVAALQKAIGS